MRVSSDPGSARCGLQLFFMIEHRNERRKCAVINHRRDRPQSNKQPPCLVPTTMLRSAADERKQPMTIHFVCLINDHVSFYFAQTFWLLLVEIYLLSRVLSVLKTTTQAKLTSAKLKMYCDDIFRSSLFRPFCVRCGGTFVFIAFTGK